MKALCLIPQLISQMEQAQHLAGIVGRCILGNMQRRTSLRQIVADHIIPLIAVENRAK